MCALARYYICFFKVVRDFILSKLSIVIIKNLREPDVKRLSNFEGNVRRDFPSIL